MQANKHCSVGGHCDGLGRRARLALVDAGEDGEGCNVFTIGVIAGCKQLEIHR